jgi:hypothetical protein
LSGEKDWPDEVGAILIVATQNSKPNSELKTQNSEFKTATAYD